MSKEIAPMPKMVALQGSDYSIVHSGSTHTNKNTGPSHNFHVMHSGSQEPVGSMTIHQTSDGGYGGGHVDLKHPDHASDAKAMKVFNNAKEHLFPATSTKPVIDVEAKPVTKSINDRLDNLIKSVEDLEKAKKIEADEKEELDKKKDKAAKADLGQYWKKPPKKPETDAPTLDYSNNTVKRTPGSQAVEAGFKVPKEAQAPLKNPKFQQKLSEQRRATGFKKSMEDFLDAEGIELEKADKDELFPNYDDMKSVAAPAKVADYPKEWAANEVIYATKRLQEIKSDSWACNREDADQKAAFELAYEEAKSNLKAAIKKFKSAKPLKKSEIMGKMTAETLTKSMQANHSDEEISAMLKAGVDAGTVHRNVMLEWQNFGTVNPSILGLVSTEE